MNILHIDDQNGWRGGEQQASYLILGLVKRGHHCVIAGRPGAPFIVRDHGVPDLPRITAPCRGEWDVLTAYTLAKAVKLHSIDILHAHTSHALTYAVLARKISGRGKVVASRRVDFPPNSNVVSRWKYRQADRIIAISDCIARVLREFGVTEAKLRTVHSGIDPDRFTVEALPRTELNIPEGAPLAGNVAALVGHKDQATLIAAAALVLEVIPEFRLVIAGEGPLRPQLEAQISRLNIGHAVTLLGHRPDIPRVLRALDVFVMSSKEEGLGTSVLDAMACGVPVVATNAGGIPEAVRNGDTGVLVNVGDTQGLAQGIIKVLGDRAWSATLAASARQSLMDGFTVDRMVAGNLAVYEELTARAG